MGFMLLVFTLYFTAVTNRFIAVEEANARLALEDAATYIQAELSLGASAVDGYYREFEIPQKISGRVYNITILKAAPLVSNHSELILTFINTTPLMTHVVFIPTNIRGDIDVESGQLVSLSKENGLVWVSN
jgi:hypothetical protein